MQLVGRLARAIVAVVVVASAACGADDGGGAAPEGRPEGGAAAADTLRIGVAYPDLEAFASLNEKFSIGDPREQAEAVLDGWRRNGMLPVHGREIEFVYRKYNVINNEQKLGVCKSFAQDDRVFAVIAGRDFTSGAECLAQRFKIPVIDLNTAPDAVYDRAAPYFFTLRTNESALLRGFAAWADDNGYLDGKRIGIFWDTRSEAAVEAFKEELAARGHTVASELSSSGEGVGSPQDQIVVQRFQSDGVDLALLFVGTSSSINVMTFAERQNYAPTYLDLDFGGHIGDVASDALPDAQYDGTMAMAISRVGEIAAGEEPPEAAAECLQNYRGFSGKDIELESPETGEMVNILYTCDLASILYAGLDGAGEDLDGPSLVAALEKIEDLEMAAWGSVSFSAEDHSGVDEQRTIEWTAGCACWTARSDFEPLLPER